MQSVHMLGPTLHGLALSLDFGHGLLVFVRELFPSGTMLLLEFLAKVGQFPLKVADLRFGRILLFCLQWFDGRASTLQGCLDRGQTVQSLPRLLLLSNEPSAALGEFGIAFGQPKPGRAHVAFQAGRLSVQSGFAMVELLLTPIEVFAQLPGLDI